MISCAAQLYRQQLVVQPCLGNPGCFAEDLHRLQLNQIISSAREKPGVLNGAQLRSAIFLRNA